MHDLSQGGDDGVGAQVCAACFGKPLHPPCCSVLEQGTVVSSESADPELTPCSDLPITGAASQSCIQSFFLNINIFPLHHIDHPTEEFYSRLLLSVWEVSMQGQLWNSASGKLKGFHWTFKDSQCSVGDRIKPVAP